MNFDFINQGKRRYDHKQMGYGGQTKPVFHKKVYSVLRPFPYCYNLQLLRRPKRPRKSLLGLSVKNAKRRSSFALNEQSTLSWARRKKSVMDIKYFMFIF